MARYNEFGEEMPDPTPVEWPSGLKRPLTLQEEIFRAIRVEMSRQAVEAGQESFEEADDFDSDDDDEILSPYELREMAPERDRRPLDPPPSSAEQPLTQAPAGATVKTESEEKQPLANASPSHPAAK